MTLDPIVVEVVTAFNSDERHILVGHQVTRCGKDLSPGHWGSWIDDIRNVNFAGMCDRCLLPNPATWRVIRPSSIYELEQQ